MCRKRQHIMITIGTVVQHSQANSLAPKTQKC